MFKFELGWLFRDGFADMVKEVWNSVMEEGDKMKCWQSKIRRLRQHLRGWAKNVSGANKKEKKDLLDTIDNLDKKAEVTLLTPPEVELKQRRNSRLSQLLREEEIKWYQRSKA
jgi:hypothetical protein